MDSFDIYESKRALRAQCSALSVCVWRCVCLAGSYGIKRCDHAGGEANVPEEYAPRRAPSCVLSGLPGSSVAHPEGLSSSAQATAGTGNPGIHIWPRKATPLLHHSTDSHSLVVLVLIETVAFVYASLAGCVTLVVFLWSGIFSQGQIWFPSWKVCQRSNQRSCFRASRRDFH